MMPTLATRLRDREQRPVVLDGGLASELERRGVDVSGRLWSAAVLQHQPEQIQAVHASYFAAGAEVATTASYQATYAGFGAVGVSSAQVSDLLRRSVELAAAARADAETADAAAGRPPTRRWVAASIGPYGAMLADGSEYRGDYGLTVPQLREFHRPRLEVLAEACAQIPDAVLAVETIPSTAEVEAIVAELAELSGIGAWISLTPDGGRTRSGEALGPALALAADVDAVLAVGVNCCDPADVDLTLALAPEALSAAGRPDLPLLAYPNTGEAWDARARRWTGPATLDPAIARGWVTQGARALGGCCRVGPALLSQLAEALG